MNNFINCHNKCSCDGCGCLRPGPQGPTGYPGPIGPAGSQGATGPAGSTGAQGTIGPSGPTGPAGPIGATGETGFHGFGGAPGFTGATGGTGPTGSTGPAGPSGSSLIAYANFFTYDSIIGIQPEDAIPFNRENVPPVGITQINEEQFIINETGVYFITYGVHYSVTTITLEAATTITVNGSPIDAFTVRSGNQIDGWNISSGLIFMTADDTVSLINTGSNPLSLGVGLPGAEAYLNFLRIAS
ncbi:MAG: BclA C-terminal domain-containing protein [Sporomusa sp.]